MVIRTEHSGESSRITLSGRFDFDSRHAFSRARDEVLEVAGPSILIVDLQGLTYIDSAALGMLLVLRDKAQSRRKSVSLASKPGVVRDILAVAHFEKLFTYV